MNEVARMEEDEGLASSRSAGTRFGFWMKHSVGRGVLVLLPIVVTVLLFKLTFDFLDQLLRPATVAVLGRHIPGVGLVGLLVVVLVIGVIGSSKPGRRVGAYAQRLLMNVPIVRSVYGAAQRLVDVVSGTTTADGARRVVLIEYPRAGALSVGFLMNLAQDEADRSLAVVYIPTAPLPNSGFVTIVPASEVYETDLSVQEAMRLVLSGGSLSPTRFAKRPFAEGQMQRLLGEIAARQAELQEREEEIRRLRESTGPATPQLASGAAELPDSLR